MVEPVKKMIIDRRAAPRPGADTGPQLDVIQGSGTTPPRAETGGRVVLEDTADDVATVIDSAEDAPTDKTGMTLQREAQTTTTAAAEAEARAYRDLADPTVPVEPSSGSTSDRMRIIPPPEAIKPPSYDLGKAAEEAAKPSTRDRIGNWLSGTKFGGALKTGREAIAAIQAKREAARAARDEAAFQKLDAKLAAEIEADKKAEAERQQTESDWQTTFAELGIMPRDPDAETRQPWDEQPSNEPVWDEKPPVDKNLEKALNAAREVLNIGWEAIRQRVNAVFEEPVPQEVAEDGSVIPLDEDQPATRLNERRIWGASVTFGVLGAFAMSALLIHQMKGFRKDLDDYIQYQVNQAAQIEAAGGVGSTLFERAVNK